jgi:CheY-like chemotaxis protein
MRRQAPHPEPKWSVRLAYPTVAVSLDAALLPPGNALRGTLRACLERREYTVYEARHGQEGVACCEAHAIAVVLTDLLMPEQEGLETIQHLRAMDPPPKIIAMSGGGATGQLNFLQAATAFGADRTFQKPPRPHTAPPARAVYVARRNTPPT